MDNVARTNVAWTNVAWRNVTVFLWGCLNKSLNFWKEFLVKKRFCVKKKILVQKKFGSKEVLSRNRIQNFGQNWVTTEVLLIRIKVVRTFVQVLHICNAWTLPNNYINTHYWISEQYWLSIWKLFTIYLNSLKWHYKHYVLVVTFLTLCADYLNTLCWLFEQYVLTIWTLFIDYLNTVYCLF